MEDKEKIKPGKFILSMLMYIIEIPILTIALSIISIILIYFISKIPFLSFLNWFFNRSIDQTHIFSDYQWIINISFLLSYILPTILSDKINDDSPRTHALATMIIGIIIFIIHIIFLIINIISGNAFLMNIIGIFVAISFIKSYEDFKE